jgi:hypothetical protein
MGKLAGFGFILEFTSRTSQPALSIVTLRRYVRTIGNVPDIRLSQAITLEQFPTDAISEGNHRRVSNHTIEIFLQISFLIFIELRQEHSQKLDAAGGIEAASPRCARKPARRLSLRASLHTYFSHLIFARRFASPGPRAADLTPRRIVSPSGLARSYYLTCVNVGRICTAIVILLV